MNGRKVVEAGSLNVTDVIGLAAFLGFFLALRGPGIRVIRVIRSVSPRAANSRRNLTPVSVLYIAERPEMSFS